MTNDLAARAAAFDSADPLAAHRSAFHIPAGVIYLDGNSLGPTQPAVSTRIADVIAREWGTDLITSWGKAGWFDAPLRVGDRIAPLIGAKAGDVAVGDSTSVNIFKALAAALHLRPSRSVIVAEARNFPTDAYMAQGLAATVDRVRVRYAEPDEPIDASLDSDVAVLLLSHVDYRTAEVRDMAAVTAAAHKAGALVLWDLSHSTGAVHVDLTAANADFAVGCTYKYLNGGPGAPAFTWVHPRHYPTSNSHSPVGWATQPPSTSPALTRPPPAHAACSPARRKC